jgi:hypothetical protein
VGTFSLNIPHDPTQINFELLRFFLGPLHLSRMAISTLLLQSPFTEPFKGLPQLRTLLFRHADQGPAHLVVQPGIGGKDNRFLRTAVSTFTRLSLALLEHTEYAMKDISQSIFSRIRLDPKY